MDTMPMEGPHNVRTTDRLAVLGILASPIEDRRSAAPDVLGHLADRLIRPSDLALVAEHVREQWPKVSAIRCGVHGDRPYLAIHIHPFSQAAQREHWPLADWVKIALKTDDLQFFLLPPMERLPFSCEVSVYETVTDEIDYGIPRAA
ncbi:MAG TPA: hypothetical protein VMY42_27355 [Thermoguttaceae bacterium]|nr:hypothetical protein [Thermoguttaceae bacterium]